jgi:hypothetical protein
MGCMGIESPNRHALLIHTSFPNLPLATYLFLVSHAYGHKKPCYSTAVRYGIGDMGYGGGKRTKNPKFQRTWEERYIMWWQKLVVILRCLMGRAEGRRQKAERWCLKESGGEGWVSHYFFLH